MTAINIIRLISLSLILFSIGVNIAILKHHINHVNLWMHYGRIGLLTSIAITLVFRILYPGQQMLGNYIFNLLLIPSIIIFTYGLLKYFKDSQKG